VGSSAEVAQVFVYDWSDDVAEHPREHDLALLVLRRPLEAGMYASLSTDDARGAEVSLVTRSSHDGVWGVDTARLENVRLGADEASGRPFAMSVAASLSGAGGAVRRKDGALVGVVMGQGKLSGAGYVARVDDLRIESWVADVASSAGAVAGAGEASRLETTIHPAGIAGAGSLVEVGADGRPTSNDPLLGEVEPLVDVSPQVLPANSPANYNRSTGIQIVPKQGAIVQRGSNYWMSSVPGDPSFRDVPSFAAAHPEAGFISTDGYPGMMSAVPSMDEVRALYSRTSMLILSSCYAGSSSRGRSNAASLAASAGIPPEHVYGCTGESFAAANALYCDGRWVDGSGQTLASANRGNGLLLNCKMVSVTGGFAPTSCY
jgi:hypothetical protein